MNQWKNMTKLTGKQKEQHRKTNLTKDNPLYSIAKSRVYIYTLFTFFLINSIYKAVSAFIVDI